MIIIRRMTGCDAGWCRLAGCDDRPAAGCRWPLAAAGSWLWQADRLGRDHKSVATLLAANRSQPTRGMAEWATCGSQPSTPWLLTQPKAYVISQHLIKWNKRERYETGQGSHEIIWRLYKTYPQFKTKPLTLMHNAIEIGYINTTYFNIHINEHI